MVRRKGAAVLEIDGELGGVPGDDVVVGQDQPVRVEDDARAGRGPGAGLAGRRVRGGDTVGDDRDDRRADVLEDVRDIGLAAGGRRGRAARGRRVEVPAGAGVEFAAAGVTADALDGVVWVPFDAWTARYVPPDASRADARTALSTKPGPIGRRCASADRLELAAAEPAEAGTAGAGA